MRSFLALLVFAAPAAAQTGPVDIGPYTTTVHFHDPMDNFGLWTVDYNNDPGLTIGNISGLSVDGVSASDCVQWASQGMRGSNQISRDVMLPAGELIVSFEQMRPTNPISQMGVSLYVNGQLSQGGAIGLASPISSYRRGYTVAKFTSPGGLVKLAFRATNAHLGTFVWVDNLRVFALSEPRGFGQRGPHVINQTFFMSFHHPGSGQSSRNRPTAARCRAGPVHWSYTPSCDKGRVRPNASREPTSRC